MSKNLYYIIGGLVVVLAGIGYTVSNSMVDTSNSSVKEPRSANSNVSNYRKGIIGDYWDSKYPGTQAGGSKRKRKNKNKTKKQKH
jgi:hypothetical protein